MLAVLAYSHADLNQAKELLRWCAALDSSLSQHELLLLASSRISPADTQEMYTLGRAVFPTVTAIKQSVPDERPWPRASNALFRTALEWLKLKGRGHWLWWEPDAIPTVSGWLDKLDAEYRAKGKPFLGTVFDRPFRHLNGVMIYPQNPGGFNPFMCGAQEVPFDCIRPELTLKHGHITDLIWRSLADPNQNLPHTFPDQSSLKIIPKAAVLAHCSKDGTLIEQLRISRNGHVPAVNTTQPLLKRIGGIFKKKQPSPIQAKTIIIRRTGAIGDALAATCVANKLIETGHKVVFQCGPSVAKVLKYCPGIRVTDTTGECHVNLDGAYENDRQKNSRHFAEMFVESANRQLKTSLKPLNIAPKLEVSAASRAKFFKQWENLPKPWIGISPRSNSFNVRTVPDLTWKRAAEYIHGTCFWLGTHKPLPSSSVVDLELNDTGKLVQAIANMDLFVGVDSGPAHIALALGVPAVVIEQASSPEVHLSDQRDWVRLSPDNLSCLNCGLHKCPINESHPPCMDIDPFQIATAANRKLHQLFEPDAVSAIIPVYRPARDMLNQCLAAVLPQVDEVIVCRDQAGTFPNGALQHPKIKYITSWRTDIGYARKLNFGMRHSSSRYCLVLNDDLWLDSDAVAKLQSIMDVDPKCAVVGHLLWRTGRKTIQHGGTQRNPSNPGDPGGWGHIDDHKEKPSVTKPCIMENVTWASVLVRRKAFYDVQGMDERFFLYYDDNDINTRLRQARWEIWYTPHAQGVHHEHASTNITPQVAKHVAESQKLFIEKWSGFFEHNRNRVPGNFNYLKK